MSTPLSSYFSERAAATDRDLNQLIRNGWRYLSIGLPVLAMCLAASQLAGALVGRGALARVIEESLVIVGWVANWKSIETLLYDRWPLHRRATLCHRLAAARVTFAITREARLSDKFDTLCWCDCASSTGPPTKSSGTRLK